MHVAGPVIGSLGRSSHFYAFAWGFEYYREPCHHVAFWGTIEGVLDLKDAHLVIRLR
jgi:hypothetical protein